MPYDIIVRNGEVFDGTKLIGRIDVGIKEDRIKKLGDLSEEKAVKEIDANGYMITPGFIDVHTHATLDQLINNNGANLIYQGVTSIITGNCGNSESVKNRKEVLELVTSIKNSNSLINVATLVGHNSLRRLVLSKPRERPATNREIKELKSIVGEALDAGAIGFSTGLMYSPGYFAEERELIAILEEVAKRGKIYTTHMRDEGDNIIDSVEESLRHARATRVKLQISHHKAVGKNNFGKINTTLDMMERSRAEVNVHTDIYVYNSTSTALSILLPKEAVKQAGGNFSKIKSSKEYVSLQEKQGLQNLCENSWKDVIIIQHKNPELVGKSIYDISKIEASEEPTLTYLSVLKEDPDSRGIFTNISSYDDITAVLKRHLSVLGSDGYFLDSDDKNMVHPRSYGNVSKYLSQYVRRGVIGLEEGLVKLTSLPAAIFGFEMKGSIKENYYADIAVLDFEKIENNETLLEPYRLSSGVEYVVCNGKLILEKGKLKEEK